MTFPHSHLQYLLHTKSTPMTPSQPSPVSVTHTQSTRMTFPHSCLQYLSHSQPLWLPTSHHQYLSYTPSTLMTPYQLSPVSVTHTQSTLMTPYQPSPVSVTHIVNPYDSLPAVTSICHTHSQPLWLPTSHHRYLSHTQSTLMTPYQPSPVSVTHTVNPYLHYHAWCECVCVCVCMSTHMHVQVSVCVCVCVGGCVHSCYMRWILTICIRKECVSA